MTNTPQYIYTPNHNKGHFRATKKVVFFWCVALSEPNCNNYGEKQWSPYSKNYPTFHHAHSRCWKPKLAIAKIATLQKVQFQSEFLDVHQIQTIQVQLNIYLVCDTPKTFLFPLHIWVFFLIPLFQIIIENLKIKSISFKSKVKVSL